MSERDSTTDDALLTEDDDRKIDAFMRAAFATLIVGLGVMQKRLEDRGKDGGPLRRIEDQVKQARDAFERLPTVGDRRG